MVIDYNNDSSALTGDFELSYVCPISRCSSTGKIELGISGKKILPPVKPSKMFFKVKDNLVVQGEKIFKPFKSLNKVQRVPMEMKISPKSEKKVTREVSPLKLYRSPRKPRKNFRTVVIKPLVTNNINNYVRKLPSVLQSTNRKFESLCDLMRHLSVQTN